MTWGDVLETYQEDLSRLEEWGIRIKPGSRLERYEQIFADQADRGTSCQPLDQVRDLLFALREIDEISRIARSYPDGPKGKEDVRRLEKLVGGTDHPDDESTHSPARDAQFELFLRSEFHQVGVQAKLGNPDLLVEIGDSNIPVEAKRPKSEKRVDEHLRKGVNQVSGGGIRGIVAISLDLIIRMKPWHLLGPDVSAIQKEVRRRIRQFVAGNMEDIVRRIDGREVMGLLLTARVPAWGTDPPNPWIITDYVLEDLHYTDEEHELLRKLYETLMEARDQLPPAMQ